jgi:hypothetical protein
LNIIKKEKEKNYLTSEVAEPSDLWQIPPITKIPNFIFLTELQIYP